MAEDPKGYATSILYLGHAGTASFSTESGLCYHWTKWMPTAAMRTSAVVAPDNQGEWPPIHFGYARIRPKPVIRERSRDRGFGALSTCMNSSGLMATCAVPSLHGVLSFNATCPAALNCTRSSEGAGR